MAAALIGMEMGKEGVTCPSTKKVSVQPPLLARERVGVRVAPQSQK
jgi:hypothetical protein